MTIVQPDATTGLVNLKDANGHQLVINNDGSLNTSASFSASSVAINDPNTTTQKMAVDASGNASVKLGAAIPAGTNVIGHVIADSGSTTAVTQATGTNLHTVVDSGAVNASQSGTWNITNISGTVSLPTGAAISAKQPALGTAGSASTDVLTVQGIASMTALKVDGSAVTQPVSGTVTVNAGSGNFTVTQSTAANLNATATIQAVTGTSLAADQSNSELRVSNYGKSTTAGDTAVLVDSTGRVLTGRSCVAVYTLASTTTSGSTQNSGDLTVGAYTEIAIDINTTAQAGTNPTIQYIYERKGADGIYYPLWQSSVLTSATNTVSTSIGVGMAYNQSLALTGRLRWVVGGSATPTFTHSLNLYGK